MKWSKNKNIEDSFESLHGYKVNVYIGENCFKLEKNGKEIVLKEVLDKGLTKDAFVEYDGQTYRFNKVYDAERKAIDLLKGE